MVLEKKMSTSLAILELVEEVTNAIDDCKSAVGVFIDLKKPLTQLIVIFSYKN